MPNVDDLRRYLKKDMVMTGDLIHFKDAGQILNKEFEDKATKAKKKQDILEMEVLINDSMKPVLYSPNKVTIDLLKEAWGRDTQNWVGETGKVSLIEQLIMGKLDTILIIKPVTSLNKAALLGSVASQKPSPDNPNNPGGISDPANIKFND